MIYFWQKEMKRERKCWLNFWSINQNHYLRIHKDTVTLNIITIARNTFQSLRIHGLVRRTLVTCISIFKYSTFQMDLVELEHALFTTMAVITMMIMPMK